MRSRLAKRGARGISALGRTFKIADDNNSGNLCREEFKKAIHDFRIGLNAEDTERLFNIFDADKSGAVDFEEFLYAVVGEMNAFRQNLAKQAFKIMDRDGNGVVDINDIRGRYTAKMHPDVIQGKKTEDEVLFEFLDTFDDHTLNSKDRDGVITEKEWVAYYDKVSMSIDRDDYFELMMNQVWNFKGDRVTKKGSAFAM